MGANDKGYYKCTTMKNGVTEGRGTKQQQRVRWQCNNYKTIKSVGERTTTLMTRDPNDST